MVSINKSSKTTRRILKNTAFLAVGTVIPKAVLFASSIFIARFFGPDKYGTYVTAFEYVNLMAIFTTLGFDTTIILKGARDIQKLDEIQKKMFPIRLFVSIFVLILSLILAFFLYSTSSVFVLILLFSGLLFTGGAISAGMGEHFLNYFRINERMEYIAFSQSIRSGIFLFLFILTILLQVLNEITLSVSVLISSAVSLVFLVIKSKKGKKSIASFVIDYDFIRSILKQTLLFGIVSVIYRFSMRLDFQMLALLGDSQQLAEYSVSWQINNIGLLFITSLSSSIFPNSARRIFELNYTKRLGLFLVGISLLTALICLVITLYSVDILLFLFGQKYEAASGILQIVIWFLPLRIVSLWGFQIMECGDYLVTRIIVFLIPMIVNISLNYFFIPVYGAYGAAYSMLVSTLLLMAISNITGYFILRKNAI